MTVLTPGYDMPFSWLRAHNVTCVWRNLFIRVDKMYYPDGQRTNMAIRFHGTLYRLSIQPDENVGEAVLVGNIYDQPLHNMN